MKIKKIILHNFRQYKDIVLDFPDTKSDYDLNYILAENGIGKTTLLNAITWCLYNSEKHITKKLEDQTLPKLTLDKLREMNIGDTAISEVFLTLSSDTEEITFHRFIEFRKDALNHAFKKSFGQDYQLIPTHGDANTEANEELFNKEVSKRLPEKIQQFFFFDGEQLDNYLEGNSGNDVQEAVLGISQIDLLISMQNRLETVHTEMRRDVAKLNPLTESINKEYESLCNSKEQLQKEINDLKKQNRQIHQEIIDLTVKLKNEPDIAKLEQDRDEYKKQETIKKDELKTVNEELRRVLQEYTFLLTALPKIRSLYDYIKEKEANNELPPSFDKSLLTKMIEKHHCDICGRDLDESSSNFISNLLERINMSTAAGTLLTKICDSLESAIIKAKNYKKDTFAKRKNKKEIEDQLKELETNIEKIDITIKKSINNEQNKKDHARLKKLEELEPLSIDQLTAKQAEISLLEEKIKNKNEELEKATAASLKYSKLSKAVVLAASAKDKVELIINTIKNDTRTKISNEMNNIFRNLMWKTDFKKVELTSDYKTSITNLDDMECLGSCSAAERELLVLAFTLALHRQSGFEGPLVIDTPISRISGELRKSFANVLKKVSKNKQIILFMTKDEYSDNVKEVLEKDANCRIGLSLENEKFVKVEKL